MRIAQLAPLWESVPPKLYGGTERIISYLTEGLVKHGHDVTLFATGDSYTTAALESVWPKALRSDQHLCNPQAAMSIQLGRVVKYASRFELIHSHVGFIGLPFARLCAAPFITTLHGRLDLPGHRLVIDDFPDSPLISISRMQQAAIPHANWKGTVHHGLPPDLYDFRPDHGKYLAFLGRIAPEKRPDRAIELAKTVGFPLRIAAKVDSADEEYFEMRIKPLISHPLIEFIGEINDTEKNNFLGDAYCVVAPHDWPEPFGLVLIESLACGTPVIGYGCGAIPEIIVDGVTGFICNTLDEMVTSFESIPMIKRQACRDHFEQNFTTNRMVSNYLNIYERMIC
jgi:glycosyltransferase involved in cell wall biosynthesis